MCTVQILQVETHPLATVPSLRRKCARDLILTLMQSVALSGTGGMDKSLPMSQIAQVQLHDDSRLEPILGIVVAAPFCFSSHNSAVSQLHRVQPSVSSSRSRQPLTPIFAHVLLAQSDAPALRHSVCPATHSSPASLPSNRASLHPAAVPRSIICQHSSVRLLLSTTRTRPSVPW